MRPKNAQSANEEDKFKPVLERERLEITRRRFNVFVGTDLRDTYDTIEPIIAKLPSSMQRSQRTKRTSVQL